MANTFIPYGMLPDGKYGIMLDEANQLPLASAIEILSGLPATTNPSNYPGRTVFDRTTNKPYVFSSNPTPSWKSIDGVPVTVGTNSGNPPTVPTPQVGELYWNVTNEVLYVWDGIRWQAVGGRYASLLTENAYTGNGVQVTYPTGASREVQSAYVEVFLDGVRQMPMTDYMTVGTVITFNTAPPNGVKIYIRTVTDQKIVQNAQISTTEQIAIAGQQTFILGGAGSDPEGVMVFVNGVLRLSGTDYTFIRHVPTITEITKTALTVARVVTTFAHQITVGAKVRLEGILEPEYNNKVFVVQSVPTPTSFTITVAATDPSAATPNPVMYHTPSFVNDRITMNIPLVGGERVVIKHFANVVTGGGNGEINTLASVGSGQSLVAPKLNETLRVKSLSSGSNITITDLGNEVQIAASLGGSFEDRVGINATNYTVSSTVSYVGVRNTVSTVTISLAAIAQLPANSGRKITIKDESGAAGVGGGILVAGGAATIDGSVVPLHINTNYGYVTLVMDGTNWFVTSRG